MLHLFPPLFWAVFWGEEKRNHNRSAAQISPLRYGSARRLTGPLFPSTINNHQSLPQSENTESSTFNLACTLYKQGKYSEAASMFAHKSKPSVEHEDITLKSLFNQGDSYAIAAIETTTKSKKTEYFQTSLDRFKLLLLTNPNDGDAKVNYEIILRYLHELDPPHHASSSSSSDQKSKPLPKTGVSQDMVDRLLEKAQQDESSLMRKLASKKSTAAKGSSNNLDW